MKISPEFERRLAAGEPDSTVQAVLLIATPFREELSSRLERAKRRREIREAINATAASALPEIDRVLAHFGGRRLSEQVDALGGLSVETTPAGIRALANTTGVRAILENQAVLPMH